MEYSIQHLSKTKIEIAFDVPKDEWTNDIKEAYGKNKHKYAIKGFRKGKVPFHIAMDSFRYELLYDALNAAVPKYFNQILKDEKDNFEAVGDPDFDDKEVSEDGLKMVITTAIRPEFQLGTYKGLDIEKFDAAVSDAEVEEEMNKILASRARLKEVERPVKDGDNVLIDFSGSVDGEKFEGGTAEKQNLVIGSGQFIPGFEEQLIGLSKGDEKDIKVTFPEDYTAPLAGKEAVFAIKIHEIKEKEMPALDDDFVKDISEELNNVEEWKASIKKQLEDKKAEQEENDFANKVMNKILENTAIELPECMVEDAVDYKIQQLEKNLSSYYGIKLEDYMKYTGKSVEDFRKEKRDEAIRDVNYELIITEIIKQEKIEFSEEEFNAELDKIPEEQRTQESFNYTINNLLTQKLFKFLKQNNNLI
ncbi:MAG: trigger factor [Clostridia bacterium]|nr:trigger factor [Clostridia bacterium]